MDMELEAQIEILRDNKRKYQHVIKLAQTLAGQLSQMMQTQRQLGDAFADLSLKSPELHVSQYDRLVRFLCCNPYFDYWQKIQNGVYDFHFRDINPGIMVLDDNRYLGTTEYPVISIFLQPFHFVTDRSLLNTYFIPNGIHFILKSDHAYTSIENIVWY